jgi:hypothetical protein
MTRAPALFPRPDSFIRAFRNPPECRISAPASGFRGKLNLELPQRLLVGDLQQFLGERLQLDKANCHDSRIIHGITPVND